MPITVYGLDGNPFDQNSIQADGARFLRAIVRFVFSGSYPTGGDVLDLTNGGASATYAAPSVVPPAQIRGLAMGDISALSKLVTGLSAIGGKYTIIAPGGVIPIPISAVNALKVKIWLASNAEYSAGAYGADVLADIVTAELVWAR